MIRKILSVILMIAMITGYVFFLREYEKEEINELPEIVFDEKHLELSVKEDQSRLLEGVYAYDVEDGDLTEDIIIDSVSEFDENNARTVKYVVFDSQNKATTATRTISYTDYTPPRIYLKGSLVQSSLSQTKLNKVTGATSSVDGDISNNVEIRIGTLADNKLDIMINAKDSTGTESTLTVTYDYDTTVYLIDIALKQYLMYLPVGSVYDFRQNIQSITMGKIARPEFTDQVVIQSAVDFNTPGVYDVYYYLNGIEGGSGRVKGVVVIE